MPARLAIDRVDEARIGGLAERDLGWCYTGDEMYLIADRPMPEAEYYDDGALYENGVGAVRRFVDGFDQGLSSVPDMHGKRIRLVTGGSMKPFIDRLAPRLTSQTRGEVDVVHVRNDYFGDSVTIAGLLGGRDILAALGEGRAGDLVIVPAEALNADDIFIDNLSMEDFVTRLGPAEVRTGYEITRALSAP